MPPRLSSSQTRVGERRDALEIIRVPWLGVAVLLTLCACAHRPAHASSPSWPTVPLTQLGFPTRVTQAITLTRESKTSDFTALIESDSTHMVIVGFASPGPRLFTVTKTSTGVVSDVSPMVPSVFRAEHLLADLESAFASGTALRAAFANTQWQLVEEGLVRSIWHDGTRVVTITRTTENPWAGPVDVDNLRYDYRLHVETLELE